MLRVRCTATMGQSPVFSTCYWGRSHATQLLQSSRAHRSYHGATHKIHERLNHARNEIRVLKVKPGRWDDDISCSLKVISLDGLTRFVRARYDTLSYTWGDPNPARTIRVNQQSIEVSTNLFVALRALRRRFTTTTIWADALCINQKDDSERSKQVALMGRIYKQGGQTWVSLGYPDEKWADRSWSPASHVPGKARMLLRLIRGMWRLGWHHIVLRRSRQSRLGVNHISDAVRIIRAAAFGDNLGDPGQTHQKIAASMLVWLARHDYWSRVWIVQEIALSRNDPICIFGRHQIPLMSLDTVLSDWLDGNLLSSERRRAVLPLKDRKGMARAQEICMLRDEYLSMWTLRYTGSMELSRALQLASFRRASVAHDHVYGLRSLISVKDQETLQPDYSLPTHELHASVTHLLLRHGKSMNMLCAAVGIGSHNEQNLPSWSLDFSKPLRLPARRVDVDGCVGSSANLIGPDILRVQGRSFGQQITTCIPRDYTFDDLMPNPVLSDFLSRAIYEEDNYRRGQGQYGTVTDFDRQDRPGSDSDEEATGPAQAEEVASDTSSNVGQRYMVFSTAQGKFGKCLNDVLQGDEIWSLIGSETPFVLRPSSEDEEMGNKYRLVGPCSFLTTTDVMEEPGTITHSIELV
jgi:hypothetical protein